MKLLCLLIILPVALRAQSMQRIAVPPPSPLRLPMKTVFRGEEKFREIVKKAESENWRARPIGERTSLAARSLLGIPYVNYTLEVHDRVENPVVNLEAMDCWTFYENALGLARMLTYKRGPYSPLDLIHMVEIERYRNGQCDGSYLSRMHHLEEVFHDNQTRGLAENLSPRLPGAERMQRQIREMTEQWESYRYLKHNPSLLTPMAQIEKKVSALTVFHVPKAKVFGVERYLAEGDICAITTHSPHQYTSHVGLIMRHRGRAHFAHATSSRDKGRRTIFDKPISEYLGENSSHAGIVVCRPKELPTPASSGN
ncbi:MAG: hypothetical protein RI957_358 [Verrucomicrobiota bacterium]|jgi:hypothetical protein